MSRGFAYVRLRELQTLWQDSIAHDDVPQYDRWLSQRMRGQKSYGGKDRRWYGDMLFAAMRFGYFAVYAQDGAESAADILAANPAAAADEARLAAFAARHPGAFADLLPAWRSLPGPVFWSWVMRRWAADGDVAAFAPYGEVLGWDEGKEALFQAMAQGLTAPDAPLAARMAWSGIPLWLAPALAARFPDATQAAAFLTAQASRPPLWLRMNRPERAAAVRDTLAREGFAIRAEDGSALAVQGAAGIVTSAAYRDGSLEIQDWASQKLAAAVAAKPGDFVWDACAGGGGKTVAVASRMANQGVLYASDVRAYKLDDVKERARRAGFLNVRCLPWEGRVTPSFPQDVARRGGFDWVLVDAPCSSSGTWRRNPDAKHRITAANVAAVRDEQAAILAAASPAVRPGGHLVYATCSWLRAENEDVVAAFLARHPAFALVAQSLVGSPAQDADTMFYAVLQRLA